MRNDKTLPEASAPEVERRLLVLLCAPFPLPRILPDQLRSDVQERSETRGIDTNGVRVTQP